MSRSVLFVFLLVISGLSTIKSQRKKYGPCEKRISWEHRGWGGGICFDTQETLKSNHITTCSLITYDANGCPRKRPACCIDCYEAQTDKCNFKYEGSYADGPHCCPGTLQIGTVREESGCVCCKVCPPKPWCRSHNEDNGYGHHCITEQDPVYNVTWCLAQPNGRIYERQCYGTGCWCCIWDLL